MTRFAPHPGVSQLSYWPWRSSRSPYTNGSGREKYLSPVNLQLQSNYSPSLARGSSVSRQTSWAVLTVLSLHTEVSLDPNLTSLPQQTFNSHGARAASGSTLPPRPGQARQSRRPN